MQGVEVLLAVGPASDQPGPLLFYWHAGSEDPLRELEAVGPSAVAAIMRAGGVIAVVLESTHAGMETAIGWHTGDFAVADEIVACATRQLNVDSRRIYALGTGNGAMHAGAMAFLRSNYVAAVVSNSGGLISDWPPLATGSVPALLSIFPDVIDATTLPLAALSGRLCGNLTAFGGFAIECAHPGNFTEAPASLIEAAWLFLNDHPYGVQPWPYAGGLPPAFPEYCEIYR